VGENTYVWVELGMRKLQSWSPSILIGRSVERESKFCPENKGMAEYGSWVFFGENVRKKIWDLTENEGTRGKETATDRWARALCLSLFLFLVLRVNAMNLN
jgi:hypothetical protein